MDVALLSGRTKLNLLAWGAFQDWNDMFDRFAEGAMLRKNRVA